MPQLQRTKYNYSSFLELAEKLVAENKTTGANHSAAYVHYTRMNLQRMNRIYSNTELREDLLRALASLEGRYTWLVLVEAWCGDVAQNLPVIAKMAKETANIELDLVLRDENLDLMDAHLTNGGRSIPKLLVIDKKTGDLVAEWGPRPAAAQKMVMDHKALEEKPPYEEYAANVQKWYAKDRTATIQAEFLELLKQMK